MANELSMSSANGWNGKEWNNQSKCLQPRENAGFEVCAMRCGASKLLIVLCPDRKKVPFESSRHVTVTERFMMWVLM